jgi:geranylgeranyl reductase family protein
VTGRVALASNAASSVDVLVVGAGPGGSTAAYFLALHGVDVALVDKAAFPRDMPCGDGLTPRAVKVLLDMGVDTAEPGFARVEGLRIQGRAAFLELPWPVLSEWPGYGLVRTRNDFDHLLAQRAAKAGARLWERTEAVGPSFRDGWVTGATLREVTDDGDEETRTVQAKFVLAADGAASRFAQQAGVRRDASRPLGIAARRYYRMQRPQEPWLESWLDLWEGDALLPGYGWLFPLPDGTVNVGAGLLNTFKGFKDVSAQKLFDAFVAMLPEDWGINEETAEGRVLSGSLPMGMNRRPLAMPGMLVVGDAAGLVNPFNGEGISYAMESGQLAAELVYEALVANRPGLAHVYPTELRRRYGRYFHIGRTFVRAIGKPQVMRTLTRYGLPQEWLMRFAMRFMANLTDGPDGDAQDRLMDVLLRLTTPD